MGTRAIKELTYDERLKLIKRINQVMVDEFDISENSIIDFWNMCMEGAYQRSMK